MKKTLILILLVSLSIGMFGCEINHDKQNEDETSTELTQQETETKLPEGVYHNVPDIHGDSTKFEEELLETEIVVRAKFLNFSVDIYDYNRVTCEFLLSKNIYGKIEKIQFTTTHFGKHCYVTDVGVGFDSTKMEFEKGKEYLLLLYRSSYKDEERIVMIDPTLVIPLEENGDVDFENCMRYGGKLKDYIWSDEITEAFENGTFIEYTINLIENKNRDK